MYLSASSVGISILTFVCVHARMREGVCRSEAGRPRACSCVQMFVHTCVRSSMHAFVCVHARVREGVCVSPSVRLSVCMFVRPNVC